MYARVKLLDQGTREFTRTFIFMNRQEIYEGSRVLRSLIYNVHQRIIYYDGRVTQKDSTITLEELNRLFAKLDQHDTSQQISDMIYRRPISMRIEYPDCCGFQVHLTHSRPQYNF